MNYKCKENIQLNTSTNYKKDTIYLEEDLKGEQPAGIEKYFIEVEEQKVPYTLTSLRKLGKERQEALIKDAGLKIEDYANEEERVQIILATTKGE